MSPSVWTAVEETSCLHSFRLAVPGLQEGRPSVIVGDFVLVKHSHLQDGRWIESRVHEVNEKDLSLRFPDGFSLYKGDKVDVRFQLNRLPFRRMIQAVTTSFNPRRLLFPEMGHPGTTRSFTSDYILPEDPLMESNEEQLNAIAVIVHQPPGSVPFVVFGP